MNVGQIYFILFLIFASDVATWEVRGWKDSRELDSYKEAQQNITIKATNNASIKEHNDQRTIQGISDDYQKSLTSIDAMYNGALNGLWDQGTTPASTSLPTTSPAVGRCNTATSSDVLSMRTKKSLISLMKIADKQTAQLLACQRELKIR